MKQKQHTILQNINKSYSAAPQTQATDGFVHVSNNWQRTNVTQWHAAELQ